MRLHREPDGSFTLDPSGCPAAHLLPATEIDPPDDADADAWATCPCVLDRGHDGDHRDGYDHTFTDAEDIWTDQPE